MTDSNTIRWGILGAARVNERFIPAVLASPSGKLVAMASRRPGAALDLLHKFGGDQGIQIHSGLSELIQNPDVDAIYIPLSNHEHAEWALKAIEAGKHVLCEKPLAIRVEDIERIESAANKKGVQVLEGFMYRFHPQHQRVRSLIESGLIGDIRYVRSSFSFMMRPQRLYRLEESIENGGGALWDIGCYAVHAARLWFDTPPLAVSAQSTWVESGADLSTSGILDFGQGQRALFDFAFDCSRRSEYEITGTLGSIKCKTVWQLPGDIPVIEWKLDDGRAATETLRPSNHFELEIEAFSQAILGGSSLPCSLEDARINCKTLLATVTAAKTGQTTLIA